MIEPLFLNSICSISFDDAVNRQELRTQSWPTFLRPRSRHQSSPSSQVTEFDQTGPGRSERAVSEESANSSDIGCSSPFVCGDADRRHTHSANHPLASCRRLREYQHDKLVSCYSNIAVREVEEKRLQIGPMPSGA